MKTVFAIVVLARIAQGSRLHIRVGENSLVHRMLERLSNATSLRNVGGADSPKYGSAKCPCVGIDNLEGTTELEYGDQKLTYPADVGARCNDWEQESHPACKSGNPPDWCKQWWCFVDPCNCELDVPAKPSTYLSTGMIEGRPIHYSYATCGSSDVWSTDEAKKKAQQANNTALCAEKVDEKLWGMSDCKCIGIDGQKGVTEMNQDNKTFHYPADAGAHCSAWEADNHPDCKGDHAPAWCHEEWCYVDPCSCHLGTPSKPSGFLPDGKYQGKPVHFSYTTCGANDAWSSAEVKAQAKENKDICDGHRLAHAGVARAASAALALVCAGAAALQPC